MTAGGAELGGFVCRLVDALWSATQAFWRRDRLHLSGAICDFQLVIGIRWNIRFPVQWTVAGVRPQGESWLNWVLVLWK
jgi:hypothetical protein